MNPLEPTLLAVLDKPNPRIFCTLCKQQPIAIIELPIKNSLEATIIITVTVVVHAMYSGF